MHCRRGVVAEGAGRRLRRAPGARSSSRPTRGSPGRNSGRRQGRAAGRRGIGVGGRSGSVQLLSKQPVGLTVKLATKFTRSNAEHSWKEFVEWIGFSTLLEALERKHKSLDDWAALQAIAPQLFSIEYGLASTLRKWRSTRKLWYPKDKPVYDAYSFVGACIELKHQLTADQARIFRRRVISEILPNGRLCHLDHEFRSAQNLLHFG